MSHSESEDIKHRREGDPRPIGNGYIPITGTQPAFNLTNVQAGRVEFRIRAFDAFEDYKPKIYGAIKDLSDSAPRDLTGQWDPIDIDQVTFPDNGKYCNFTVDLTRKKGKAVKILIAVYDTDANVNDSARCSSHIWTLQID